MKKRGQKAQSQIITTVLIILMVLVAIVIVWNVVNVTIRSSSKQVGVEQFTTNLEIKEVKLDAENKIIVKRLGGKETLSALKIIIYDENGKSYIQEITDNLPNELETKVYDIELPEVIEVDKIGVVPVFEDGKTGIEVNEKTKEGIFLPKTNLVSWWKFNGDAKDSVGDNDGTEINQANTNGNVLNLDGDGDYVYFGGPTSLNANGSREWTVTAWAKPLETGELMYVFDKGWVYYALDYTDSGSVRGTFYSCGIPGTHHTNILNSPVSINEWDFMALTVNFDESVAKLYYNDVIEEITLNTNEHLWEPGNHSVYIGAYNYGTYDGTNYSPGDWFNGSIDNVMIFNKSLSSEEITAIYNNQKK